MTDERTPASRRLRGKRRTDWVDDGSLTATETLALFQGLVEETQRTLWHPNWWLHVTAGPR